MMRNSLEWTKIKYQEAYGPFTTEPRIFTFIHSSEKPLRPESPVYDHFRDLFIEARKDNKNVMLVINGYDGLTTDRPTFLTEPP